MTKWHILTIIIFWFFFESSVNNLKCSKTDQWIQNDGCLCADALTQLFDFEDFEDLEDVQPSQSLNDSSNLGGENGKVDTAGCTCTAALWQGMKPHSCHPITREFTLLPQSDFEMFIIYVYHSCRHRDTWRHKEGHIQYIAEVHRSTQTAAFCYMT